MDPAWFEAKTIFLGAVDQLEAVFRGKPYLADVVRALAIETGPPFAGELGGIGS